MTHPSPSYLVHSFHEGGHDDWEDLATARLLGELPNVQQIDAFVGE
jgi:hypothetical protein